MTHADPRGRPPGAAPEVTRIAPILIVDDNAGSRLAMRAEVASLGYEIVEADSGVAALRCILAQDFAVILLDIRMPEMDGFETAARIRQRWQSEMTPIIFVTAEENDIDFVRYAEGPVDFISLPGSPGELRARVAIFAHLYVEARTLAARARAVKRTADQFWHLTDASPIGIFQTDSDNRYVYTNPRWSEITGIAADAAAGQDWASILGPKEQAELVAELPDGPSRAEFTHRFEIEPPGGAVRVVLVSSNVVYDVDGTITGWVGTLADVSAEAVAEAAIVNARDEATKLSRLKSDFLANMSHEIRTPMNGVIGMIGLLLETDLDDRQRDYAQTVRDSGEALLTIVNDILDLSKVEAGHLDIEEISFGLRTLVEDVMELLAGPAQAKGLELLAVIDKSVPELVNGDPGRVRQVLTNLIGNAVKFTHTGEIVVRVTQAPAGLAGTVVQFEVTDTGDGIAAEQLGKIFKPFVQADASTSRKYGGTGLGLAICSHLVELMGGACGVSSEIGVGSRFWFTIGAHARARQARAPIASPEDGLGEIRVLVVDDNAAHRELLSDQLIGWGMAVSTADSARVALTTLRSSAAQGRPYSLALVDRSMPGMDGLELCEAVASDPALSARLVLMTDQGEAAHVAPPGESGVTAALTKPVHRDDLLACLRAALGLRPAAVALPAPAAPAAWLDGPATGLLLLAEDNLTNQKVAVAMLSSAGYRVDTVLNGSAAVQAAALRSYDAILMDCQMPELNGYEATTIIREQEGTGRHTPIIAMTAGARREDEERCLAVGMDSYLAKPMTKGALLALVASSLHPEPV